MRDPAASIPNVVEAARRDPATAGAIIQLANSALYADLEQVSALHMAVARLGFDTARKVVASLAMRPLLFLPKLESLWPHSIEVADLAEQLAGRARGIDAAKPIWPVCCMMSAESRWWRPPYMTAPACKGWNNPDAPPYTPKASSCEPITRW